ncbi:MAG: alpha/beta hydrolase [Novosphingobium sp.]|jgi:dienelactone hydrolase|nr:alpha/beta hydrolase [Novosphingobium sp.]
MRSVTRFALLASLIAQTLAPTAMAQADRWAGDGGLPAFYQWNKAVPERPGTMLRTEVVSDAAALPAAGRTERILYSSTHWRDAARATTVSGIVYFPKGKPPRGGWPVIAWAHGTTGIADVCAPSFMARSPRDTAFFGHWLDAGYAIVATDYEGLGSPGVHPYLNYRSEGIAVLDAIRAATRHYRQLSSSRIMTMGQSQGSEGAIAAAYLAPTYAPDVRIRGTVATGLVARTANTGGAHQVAVPNLYVDAADYGNSAYEILWFLGTAHALDPAAIRPEDYISDAGRAMLEKAQTTCMGGLRSYAKDIEMTVARLYKRSIDDLEVRAAAETAFPDVHVPTPVFIGTGLADADAQPAKQYNFASAMCAAGTRVQLRYYAQATHGSAVERSLADAPAFAAAVMAGRAITDDCATLAPPPLSQEAAHP